MYHSYVLLFGQKIRGGSAMIKIGSFTRGGYTYLIYEVFLGEEHYDKYIQARNRMYVDERGWETCKGRDALDVRSRAVVVTTSAEDFIGGFRLIVGDLPVSQELCKYSGELLPKGSHEISRLVWREGSDRAQLGYLKVVTCAVLEYCIAQSIPRFYAIFSEVVHSHVDSHVRVRIKKIAERVVIHGKTDFSIIVMDTSVEACVYAW